MQRDAQGILSRKAPSGLEITYQSPEITDKGGACTVAWKSVKVLGQTLSACEDSSYYNVGYLMNKTNKIEYAFWIDDSNVAALKFKQGEFEMYKAIVLTGMSFK